MRASVRDKSEEMVEHKVQLWVLDVTVWRLVTAAGGSSDKLCSKQQQAEAASSTEEQPSLLPGQVKGSLVWLHHHRLSSALENVLGWVDPSDNKGNTLSSWTLSKLASSLWGQNFSARSATCILLGATTAASLEGGPFSSQPRHNGIIFPPQNVNARQKSWKERTTTIWSSLYI